MQRRIEPGLRKIGGMCARHVLAKTPACFILLLTVVMCARAQTVEGQAGLEQKRAEAAEAAKEGAALQQQGTAQSLHQALEKYEAALKLWREVADRKREATTLNDMGTVYYQLGEYQQAINNYNSAIAIYHETASLKNEAITRRNLALIYQYAGDLPKALEQLNAFLDFMRQNNDQTGQAYGLSDIGGIYFKLGDYKKALDYYEQALALAQTLQDRDRQAGLLNRIGEVQQVTGQPQKALDSFSRALEIYHGANDAAGEIATYTRLAALHNSLGDYQQALDYYWRAYRYYDSVGDRKNKAPTLHNLGLVYLNMGDERRALKLFSDALTLARQLGDREGEAYLDYTIARLCFMLDGYALAFDYYNKALPIFRGFHNKQMEAETLGGIGRTLNAQDEKQKALDALRQALPFFHDAGYREMEAETLADMGRVLLGMKEYAEAAKNFERAAEIAHDTDHTIEASALSGLATVERDRGNLAQARVLVEKAIKIVESTRGQILNPDLRASFFAYFKNYYDLYVDILMRLHEHEPAAGLNLLALQASESGRARSLFDLLLDAQTDKRRGADPSLLERERQLQQQISLKASRQRQLPSASDESNALAREIEQLRIELLELQTKIIRDSPNYVASLSPLPKDIQKKISNDNTLETYAAASEVARVNIEQQALNAGTKRQDSEAAVGLPVLTAKDIQTKLLDPETLVIEYTLGDDRSYAWAMTSAEVKSFVLPKRSEIEEAARRVRETLSAQSQAVRAGETSEQRGARVVAAGRQYPEAAANLSGMVLAPIAGMLKDKRLVIIADGALQYVPFAALPVTAPGQQTKTDASPLITEHEITMLPSLGVLALLERQNASRGRALLGVAVFADPVFEGTDARVKQASTDVKAKTDATANAAQLREAFERGGVGLTRLAGTRREAEAIMKLDASGKSRQWLDFDASRETVLSTGFGDYRFLHFATHGLIDSDRPELSALALSMVDERGAERDGYVRAQDFSSLKLKADLVVLSACETALGRQLRGEGLIGLTQGFMRAGVPRVVVSLWSVDDAATAELMSRFYRKLLKEEKRPAAALREAQIEMFKQTDEPRWHSPYYWAPFILIGNWR